MTSTAVDFSTSGVPPAPLLPPTMKSISGGQTLRVHEAAINYSLPRTTSGVENLPKTGNQISTSKRPRLEIDGDTFGRYKSPDPVRELIIISIIIGDNFVVRDYVLCLSVGLSLCVG